MVLENNLQGKYIKIKGETYALIKYLNKTTLHGRGMAHTLTAPRAHEEAGLAKQART